MSQRKRKRYSLQFKLQAIEKAKAGRPVPELAEELEIGKGLIYEWPLSSNSTTPFKKKPPSFSGPILNPHP